MKKTKIAYLLLLFLFYPFSLKANNLFSSPKFNPNHILDDRDIFNVNSLSFQDLDLFLKTKGKLGWLKLKDIDEKN